MKSFLPENSISCLGYEEAPFNEHTLFRRE